MDLFRSLFRGLGPRRSAQPAGGNVSGGSLTAGEIIKEPPMVIDGRCMSSEEFVRYVEGLAFEPPLPTRIFLHHTWRPTREQWRGRDTILAMKAYYERQLWQDSQGRWHEGWTAGPHLFIAEDGIWLFSDLRYDGVGVYGHNYRSRHVEMVGDYDVELPSGATLTNTIAALGILHDRLGLDINALNFHRDFSSKSCPGAAVQKSWIIPQVVAWIESYRRAKEAPAPSLRQTLTRMIQDMLVHTEPSFALAKAGNQRGLVGAITDEIPMEIDNRGYVVQFFAEALLVPVNQWDKVQSLAEYERARSSEAPESLGTGAEVEIAPPPTDPYDFQGRIR